jgi:hypothetical protein
MVDMRTKSLSGNKEAYNKVKRPCDDEFGRGLPTSSVLAVRQQLAVKWAREYPKQGKVFTPKGYLLGKYIVAPSDCDTYNTLYHPMVTSVAEYASLAAGGTYCCKETTAFFCKFISTLPPGSQLTAHIFVNETEHDGTRVLTVFDKDGEGCALCTFAVYGGPLPGTLYDEEIQAVDKKNADALIQWASTGALKSSSLCDLSNVEGNLEKTHCPQHSSIRCIGNATSVSGLARPGKAGLNPPANFRQTVMGRLL